MIASLALLLLLATQPAASSAPAATPAPTAAAAAPANGAPLRTVVYNVSSMRKESLAIGTYGGHVAGEQGGGYGESNPTSKNNVTLEEGTLKVEVIGIQDDVIKVRITEVFRQQPTPNSYDAYIAPNGLVRFDTQEPSPIARYLLPLFGSKFAASSTLANGDSWHLDVQTQAVNVQNTFTIAGQDGPFLLLNETETVRLSSARGLNYNVRGKLKYKPSLLVPITGDIDERGNTSTMDSTDETTTTVHFERVSDTLDTGQTATK